MEILSLTVICIDDDEFMLKAIGRMIRRLRPNWNLISSTNPLSWQEEWNKVQQEETPAIFISDLLMPKKRGDQLLEEVKDIFPDALRVLLTGDTAHTLPEQAQAYAHFVVPKPFTEDDFEHLFQCAERLHMMPFDDECRRKLGGLSDIPVLPNTVLKLQQVIHSPSCDLHKIAEVISHEPALVARIFQLANSPYLGFRRSTESLPEAVGRLGATLVESLAVSQLTRISHKHLTLSEHKKIAEDALETAAVARLVAKSMGLTLAEQDKVFAAGLLSSIGVLIMAEQGLPLEKLTECLGLQKGYKDTHIVAAYVLIMWGYDIDLGDIILNQNSIVFDEGVPLRQCASIVGLATHISMMKNEAKLLELAEQLPEAVAKTVVELIPILLAR